MIKGTRDENVKSNNYLHYDKQTGERLEAIAEAKAAGFTINEINQLIDACLVDTYAKEQKPDIIDKKLESLDQKISGIEQMKKKLNQFRKEILSNK